MVCINNDLLILLKLKATLIWLKIFLSHGNLLFTKQTAPRL